MSSSPQNDGRGQAQSRDLAGVNLLAESMPGYHTATVMVRVEGGVCSEPEAQLGMAYILEQALDKGSANKDARELADAFDAIGARHAVYTGRQSWVLVASSLPEHLPRSIELLGEIMTTPQFPDEMVHTAVALTQQELTALEDSPRGLLRRQMARQAYGEILGRHSYGTRESLERITPEAIREHWNKAHGRSGLAVTVAGAFDLPAVEQAFSWLGELPAEGFAERSYGGGFEPGVGHVAKPELEQTQIGISTLGVPYDDDEQAIEKVLLGVLSGGMSSRLFTEVREKQGLVYWVGAWAEQPRDIGMLHIGAATKPDRAKKTYDTLLREIARLTDDLTEEELERAKTGLIAESVTSGASVQQRANDLFVDQFHLGHAVPAEERREAIRAVTVADIHRYLEAHPRDALSIVTVGPEPLADVSGEEPSPSAEEKGEVRS